ncbi:MAG: hypothetical protein IK038_11920 [Bacteroidaceae bacterium]|nr:hypothetical protein [Bacteroidaceae bacterium]
MMNNRNNPPMPPNWEDPSHIPHFPDWPNVPYADWPRTRFHRWNDSEPANVQPWWQDCCEPYENPCVCVTSADVDLWNSYSGLSGLTGFDPETISAAVSSYSSISAQLEQFSGWDDLKYGYDVLSANSGMWNSAGYVPNIYENLSALASGKLDVTASRVWTDSLKSQAEFGYYGPFEGTIDGDGSYDRPLRVSTAVAKGMATVMEASDNFNIPLANKNDITKILDNYWDLSGIWTKTDHLAHQNQDLIEWILNHLSGEWHWADLASAWVHKAVTRQQSSADPERFYYWEEN